MVILLAVVMADTPSYCAVSWPPVNPHRLPTKTNNQNQPVPRRRDGGPDEVRARLIFHRHAPRMTRLVTTQSRIK